MRQHDTCFLIPDVITDAVQEKGSPREFQNCRDFLSIWLSSIWRTLQRSDLFWGHTGRIGLPAYTCSILNQKACCRATMSLNSRILAQAYGR